MRLKSPPTDPTRAVYFCPVCLAAYDLPTQAVKCAARTKRPVYKVGDFVVIDAHYHWTEGPDAELWTFDRKGGEFHGDRSFRFWFVVTSVDTYDDTRARRPFTDNPGDAHRVIYSVASRAIMDENGLPFSGWTPAREHRKIIKGGRVPAEVRRQGQQYLGKRYRSLL